MSRQAAWVVFVGLLMPSAALTFAGSSAGCGGDVRVGATSGGPGATGAGGNGSGGSSSGGGEGGGGGGSSSAGEGGGFVTSAGSGGCTGAESCDPGSFCND